MNRNKKVFTLLPLFGATAALFAQPTETSAQVLIIAQGTAQEITAHGQCRRVTNHALAPAIMVPVALAAEWFGGESFQARTPAGISLSPCSYYGGGNEGGGAANGGSSAGDGEGMGDGGGGGGGGGGGCFAAGTMIALMDGTFRAIEDIRIGDRLKGGGRVYMTGAFLAPDLFNLNGVMVTGSHLVKSAEGWVEVKDHREAVPAVMTSRKVYNLASTCNRIETGGMIFADYAEISGPLVEDLLEMRAEWDQAAQAA